jgi:hypothetical protein
VLWTLLVHPHVVAGP